MGHVVELPDQGGAIAGTRRGRRPGPGQIREPQRGHPAYPRHGMARVGTIRALGMCLAKACRGRTSSLVPRRRQMRPWPSSAPAITSGASRPARDLLRPIVHHQLATRTPGAHERVRELSASALLNCPAKTWANVAYRIFSGVSGARAGSVPTFPRGTSCPRLFIRAWTAEPPGRPGPPARPLRRPGLSAARTRRAWRVAAEPVPGEGVDLRGHIGLDGSRLDDVAAAAPVGRRRKRRTATGPPVPTSRRSRRWRSSR